MFIEELFVKPIKSECFTFVQHKMGTYIILCSDNGILHSGENQWFTTTYNDSINSIYLRLGIRSQKRSCYVIPFI